jgi:hypothetical protein
MRVHSRETNPPSARRCQASHTFRPRGFSPPRRLSPHIGSRVCCTPQPVLGFVAFRAGALLATVNPSKGSPRRQPCHVTVAVCLPAVTGEMSKPVAEALGDSGPKPTNHQVEAPVCRSRPPRRPARARCKHPAPPPRSKHVPGYARQPRRTSHPDERGMSLLRITGGHGRRSGRAARCAVANAGEPAGGRASSSKHLAKRPTSRPCSADESVASHRRCQRGDTRSFHGFCPLQGPRPTAPERRCRAERGSLTRFADRSRSLGGARRVCPVAGSNLRWPREAGRWIRPSWGF